VKFGERKKTVDFNEKIKQAKYERIYQTLKDILNTDVKAINPTSGKEETDYATLCSAIKTKARLAIDFVADLEKDTDKN
jgi:hypothetical protein